ncbi:MAG: TPR end-of-group domain-containing protein [Armatimonadota bacterium]
MPPEPSLDPVFKYEAIGDWSGLKGSHYHLVYGVYLLLVRGRTITFYAGNDLLSTPPPECTEADAVSIRSSASVRDEWVQLKNVADDHRWTVYRILSDERLLLNLILNGLVSASEGREWTAVLASPAPIAADDIENYLHPPGEPEEKVRERRERLQARFAEVVAQAVEMWEKAREESGRGAQVTAAEARAVAERVLGQIALSPRSPIQFLIDGIEKELLKIYPDAHTVGKVVLALCGAIQEVGDAPAARPLTLTLAWLEERTGFSLVPRDLLPRDVVKACQLQVERACPTDWSPQEYVSRSDLIDAVEAFRNSDRTLFVLTGDSGAGKSWGVAGEAVIQAVGRIRALVRGTILERAEPLAKVIADAFRDMSRADASDETILRCLLGSAADPDRGPLMLIADDLPLSPDPARFEGELEALCQQARNQRVKVLLVARTGVWNRLSRQRQLEPYLFRRTGSVGDTPQFSFRMDTLTDTELEATLRKRVRMRKAAERLLLMIRRPEFAALGNPYLLTVYLDQVNAGLAPPKTPPWIDDLLTREIARRFQSAAASIDCEQEEMDQAQESLVAAMWAGRSEGVPSRKLITLFNDAIPEEGRTALRMLQREDILTPGGDIRTGINGNLTYSNPQFGEQLTANWLACRMEAGDDVLAEMEPGQDDGVLTALVRGEVDRAEPDVLTWSEGVLLRNPDWLPALSQGLAQRRSDDPRVPALLTAWSRRDLPGAAYHTMRALGSMVGRSAHARAAVRALYSDEDAKQAIHGQIALGSALDVAPRWVERRMRVRLRREFSREPCPSGPERQYRFIRDALVPLREVSHERAASVARRLLAWVQAQPLPEPRGGGVPVTEQFRDVIDAVRGRVALFGSPDDLKAILDDLHSEDPNVRAGSARALREFVREYPEPVRTHVLEAVAREAVVAAPICDLLYPYADSHPADVVDAIEKSGVLSTWHGGIALAILSRAAALTPEKSATVLPEQLELPATERALLSEELALAWWQLGRSPTTAAHAREVLQRLSVPDLEGVDPKYRVFALRGASVAVLAQIGLDISGMSEAAREVPLMYHLWALEANQGLCYALLDDLCRRFAPEITAHGLFPTFRELSIEGLQAYKRDEIHPIERQPAEWQFRVANLCTDCLCALADHLENPGALVRALPADWPAIRLAQAVLKADKASDELINLACNICRQHQHVFGSNVVRDRDDFLMALQSAGRVPEVYAPLVSHIGAASNYGVAGMGAEVAGRPEALLDQLHARVTKPEAVPFLWEWSSTPADWSSVLVGEVFRAMWSCAPLSLGACRCLCDRMLLALDALPSTDRQKEWIGVYGALREFAYGRLVEAEIIHRPQEGEDLVTRSHRAALAVVDASQAQPRRPAADWFREHVRDGNGLVIDELHRIENGSVVQQSGYTPSVYCLPALRIALAIAAAREGEPELISCWTRDWVTVGSALRDGALGGVLRGEFLPPPGPPLDSLLATAYTQVEALASQFPDDAQVRWAEGHVLLRQARFEEARDALEASLSLPDFGLGTHTNSCYDLACVYSALGEPECCRELLEQAIYDSPRLRSQAAADPDFASVSGESWFLALLERRVPEDSRLS